MPLRRLLSVFVVLATLVCAPSQVLGQDAWVKVTSANFTVMTNSNERTARALATQFERVRFAITSSWPWAKAQLDRPVVVLAAKDESTMKRLLPEYWAPGSPSKPSSLLTNSPDSYFIVVRADQREDDTINSNPYQSAYWAYSYLALQAGFEAQLPLWFQNGLASILSNSIVRPAKLEFGRPVLNHIRTINGEPRLTLSELLQLDRRADYYRQPITRQRFDAQSWAVMHYLIFGRPDARADAVNQIVRAVAQGQSSVQAVESVFGSLDVLEQEYRNYIRSGIVRYAIINDLPPLDEARYAAERLTPVAVRNSEMALHVAMGNPVAARALIAEAMKESPVPAAAHEAEALLLDREGKAEQAQQAWGRAVAAGSVSSYAPFRLASLEWKPRMETAEIARREMLLKQSVGANARFAPAHTSLADLYIANSRYEEALTSARTAVQLDGSSVDARLVLARALWGGGRREEGRGQALAARSLADSDDERAEVQRVLEFFSRQPMP